MHLGDTVREVIADSDDLHTAAAKVETLRAGQITWITVTSSAIARSLVSMFGAGVGPDAVVKPFHLVLAPVLIVVGSLMIGAVNEIHWDQFDEEFPAFLIVLPMPLTSSIATGIALGFISYPLIKIFKGKWKSVHPILYIFAVLFTIQILIAPH